MDKLLPFLASPNGDYYVNNEGLVVEADDDPTTERYIQLMSTPENPFRRVYLGNLKCPGGQKLTDLVSSYYGPPRITAAVLRQAIIITYGEIPSKPTAHDGNAAAVENGSIPFDKCAKKRNSKGSSSSTTAKKLKAEDGNVDLGGAGPRGILKEENSEKKESKENVVFAGVLRAMGYDDEHYDLN
ncbi:hypothetical protein V3C99_017542 [Haemonchus contortus]|nr:unnamed protein product [Haemonchus contortus]